MSIQAIEARLIDEEDTLTLPSPKGRGGRGLTPPPTGEGSVGVANAG